MLNPSSFLDKHATVSKEKRKVLICGSFDTVPDGSFDFVVVNGVYEMLTSAREAEKTTVLSFDEDAAGLIEIVDRFGKYFDFTFAVLTGVPECTYSPEFEAVAGKFAQISYHLLFNEIISNAELGKLADAEKPKSIYDKEMKQITRANGSIKQLRAFDAPNMRLEDQDDETDVEN